MIIPKQSHHLHLRTIAELESICNRLYCTAQAALYGNTINPDHLQCIGAELHEIWDALVHVVAHENQVRLEITEDLKKFEQGFGYSGPLLTQEIEDIE